MNRELFTTQAIPHGALINSHHRLVAPAVAAASQLDAVDVSDAFFQVTCLPVTGIGGIIKKWEILGLGWFLDRCRQ